MIKVIINADDLGINPVVNSAIEDALRNNKISSSTILANSNYMDEVKRITEEYGDSKSFGVHLNITEGLSLTKNPVLKKAGMIDEDGAFVKKHNFESRIYKEEIIKAVEKEWDAQIDKVLSYGIKISHVDGHHHCHTWYGYTVALMPLLQKYSIEKIRNVCVTPIASQKERIIGATARIMLKTKLLDASKTELTDSRIILSLRHAQDKIHYGEITYMYKKCNYFDAYEEMYRKIKSKDIGTFMLDGDTLELMCHPGHKNYQSEMKLIQQDAIGIGNNERISMINYNEL